MGAATCLLWVAARVGGGEELGGRPGKLLPLLQDWTWASNPRTRENGFAWPILIGWWHLALGPPSQGPLSSDAWTFHGSEI